jgi:hypothetical protein
VYFADNMVFTPQWREGNFVRIEMMVIDMSNLVDANLDGVIDPMDIPAADIDIYTQAEILALPANVLNTRMVSVASIQVDIVYETGITVWTSYSEWRADGSAVVVGNVGREVNSVGHLIYGGQWDSTNAAYGVYTVWVSLGSGYNVLFAMASYKIGEDTYFDPDYPYIELADDELDWQYVEYDIGVGDVSLDGNAWLVLGPLMGRGGGANGGNGNGGGGNGGNGNGGKK